MAKLDTAKPVRTRDGRKARIIRIDQKALEGPYIYTIRAEVEHPNEPGQWVGWNYLPDGRWKSNDSRNGNDLINVRPWHRWMDAIRGVQP